MNIKVMLAILGIVVAIVVVLAIAFLLICIVVSAVRYLYGEAIHTVRNMKRSVREFMWDIEWNMKRR